MVKVLNQYFPGRLFVLLITENLVILFGVWVALSLHRQEFQLEFFRDPEMFWKAALITGICQICLYYNDLYDLRSINSRLEVLTRLLQATGMASLLLAAVYLILPQTRFGAGMAETSVIAVVALILLWRVLVEWVNRAYSSRERILLVGLGENAAAVAREIRSRRDLPMRLEGIVSEPLNGAPAPDTSGFGLPVLGSIENLDQVIEELKPDRIVIALQERRRNLPVDTLLKYRMRGVLIEEASTLYEKLAGKVPVESIHPSWLIFSDGFRKSRTTRFYKRIIAILGSLVGLLLTWPIMLLVALAIKLESKGPVLYRQKRVGLNGREFDIMKFRSMRSDAEKTSGPVWAGEDDPRITRIGRIIRKLRFDELPQFVNVLKADMTFVGPRPERPYFVQLLREKIPFYDQRHTVRPGITGWAQVCGNYGASVEESKDKLEYDLFYIKNMSMSLDLLIMFQTIKIMLFGRGAR